MKTLPEFNGKSLVNFEADILGGSFGESVNKEVQRKYGVFPVINKVKYNPKEKQVEGSTPFYIVAVNEVIRPERLRTITLDDAKLIRRYNLLDLRGKYEDIAGVARNLKGSNEYIARKILEQGEQKLPITINLCDFDLVKDNKSEDGLILRLREDARIIQGDAAEYKGSGAFSRLCLGRDLDLGSDYDGLAYSDDGGRVVVVKSGEAALQKILEAYTNQIINVRKSYDSQLAELERKIKQERASLKN